MHSHLVIRQLDWTDALLHCGIWRNDYLFFQRELLPYRRVEHGLPLYVTIVRHANEQHHLRTLTRRGKFEINEYAAQKSGEQRSYLCIPLVLKVLEVKGGLGHVVNGLV